MFKLIDTAIPPTPPAFDIHSEKSAHAGETLTFTATAPALTAHWDFGDGTTDTGLKVHHAYTQSGDYIVRATATGLDATTAVKTVTVKVTGNINTRFVVSEKKRPQ
jgi:PKD repeat protein